MRHETRMPFITPTVHLRYGAFGRGYPLWWNGCRVRTGGLEHNFSLYADDLVLYLTNPQSSIPTLSSILTSFASITDLKINHSKLELYPIHLSDFDVKHLTAQLPYKWVTSSWRHLGVHIPVNFSCLSQNNYTKAWKEAKNLMCSWHKLN